MSVDFWLSLLIIKLYSQKDVFKFKKKSTLKANLNQQKKYYNVMLSKIKNKITKQKTKFLIMFFILYFAVLSTTQGPVKLIYCANQLTGFYITNKHCKVKGLS